MFSVVHANSLSCAEQHVPEHKLAGGQRGCLPLAQPGAGQLAWALGSSASLLREAVGVELVAPGFRLLGTGAYTRGSRGL